MLKKERNISKLYVTGSNASGQTGLDLSQKQFIFPRPCHFGVQIIQISCGFYHTIMLVKEGLVYQSGDQSSQPVILNLKNITKIAAGGWHNMAQSDHNLYSWGRGEDGQLGLSSLEDQSSPQLIPLEKRSYEFALGGHHTFIWNAEQVMSCGKGTFGQLGHGSSLSASTFTKLDILNVRQVDCGDSHTLLLDKSNKVWICGLMGQSFAFNPIEVLVPQGMQVVSVCAGRRNSALIGADGELYILDDKSMCRINIKAHKIKMRSDSYIIQDKVGDIYSWGKNNYGELGHGDIQDRPQPTLIRQKQMDVIIDFDLGETHAIFLGEPLDYVDNHEENPLMDNQSSYESDLYKESIYFSRKGKMDNDEKENYNPLNMHHESSSEMKVTQNDSLYTPEVSQYSLSIHNILKDKKIADLQLELSSRDQIINKLKRQITLMEANTTNHQILIKDLQKQLK